MLVAEIDEKHKGDYDFLCLPTDFKVLYYKREWTHDALVWPENLLTI